MRKAAMVVGILALVLAGSFAIWKRSCGKRSLDFRTEVTTIENDARDALRVGTNKPAVERFFEEHKMHFVISGATAYGSIGSKGCAPFGCGANTAIITVSVDLDATGTVTAEPHTSGIYTDCL
jgi:hypothetical protein